MVSSRRFYVADKRPNTSSALYR